MKFDGATNQTRPLLRKAEQYFAFSRPKMKNNKKNCKLLFHFITQDNEKWIN
jgi:hypothetical protein